MRKIAIALCVVGSLVGCERPTVEQIDPKTRVKVLLVESADSRPGYEFVAEARAADKTPLSFRIGGEVSSIPVVAGQFVDAGDTIAVLEPTDFKIAVDDANARFGVADSQYRRSAPLVDKGFLPQAQFDEIRAQRAIELAKLNLAKLRLGFTELKAPFSGVISKVYIDQFEKVGPGQAIVNLHRTDSVEIEVQASDNIYASKTPEQVLEEDPHPIVVLADGTRYTSRIKEFTTEPDPRLGSFVVTLTMPMPDDRFILDGMAVEVTTEDQIVQPVSVEHIVVPMSAVFSEDGDSLGDDRKFVWIVNDDNSVTKRQVRLGALSPKGVAITAGINIGERIVVSGVNRLRDGWIIDGIEVEKELTDNES
uniref:efflux RND transporter periplasmic adaptor subunit n=1 Tax=Thaumasiovibrio occultus TaxID=1891184 RepID=UPI000B3616A8|nr:efflux RND transporter periplasmic adaptor subunit [Thaumasiovibrio occultus]